MSEEESSSASLAKSLVRRKGRMPPIYYKLSERDEPFIRSELLKFTPLFIIAQKIGCNRNVLSKYIRANMPEVFSEMKESMKDLAESKLLENIKGGNENAIEYFLDRQARDRGYGEKIEVPASSLPTINIGRIEVVQKQEVIEVKE